MKRFLPLFLVCVSLTSKVDLEKQLKEKGEELTKKQRETLTKLIKSCNGNDNDYIIYGKLK